MRRLTSPKQDTGSLRAVVGVTTAGTRCVRWALALVAAALVAPAAANAASYAKGIDVSNWNGSIDWIQVAGDGYSFLFAKATEGTTFTDVTYAINRAGTQGLGLRLGAYHFARPVGTSDATIVASAVAQADHFVDIAQPSGGDLPPVLDLEVTGGLAPSALLRWTQAWLDEVHARTGVTALVYASPSFWKTKLGDSTVVAGSGAKLWIAHWTTNAAPTVPASNWNGLGWSFWQWTDCVQVPGFAHCSDGDRANGPSPVPFAIAPFPSGSPVVSSPPTIVGAAQAGAKLAGVPGSWNGGKPVAFSYQWQSCDAAGGGCMSIPGATFESYTPATQDVGHALVLTVTATTSSGNAVVNSPATVAIGPAGSGGAARPATITAPAVTGTAQVGQVLASSVGTWSGSPSSFAYVWRRCDGAGASCTAIDGATASTYTLTPGDIGATVSLVVTATGKGGSQSASAPTTAVVAPAPVPQAVAGSLVAQPGAAGAVVTTDARATVTWQPGAVANGSTVSLTPLDPPLALPTTGVTLAISPSVTVLPWPVDLVYAAAPTGQVVGYSTDGKVWSPVGALTDTTLPVGLNDGVFDDGTTVHVVTRLAGSFALFKPGAWGDPTQVSAYAPVLRRLVAPTRTRLRDGSILLVTRFSTSSQSDLYANVFGPAGTRPLVVAGSRLGGLVPTSGKTAHTRLLVPGEFPVRLRLSGRALVRGARASVRITAIDPWGRRAVYVLGFVAP